MNKSILTKNIKNLAYDLGFDLIGISNPEIYPKEFNNLNSWLDNNYHASMQWINNRRDERNDVFKYFPNVKTIISFGHNYFTGRNHEDDYKISNYAWGNDYHIVIKEKLEKINNYIKENSSAIESRLCVDTSPIMEKPWGQRAGLGWIGKNTNLINNKIGSWFFLSEILLDIELDFDQEFNEDLCGSCTACIDLCPTEALEEYVLDSNKCISYLTIEHRGDIDESYHNNLNDWIYGCDICQEVCPWNIKFEQNTKEENFSKRKDFELMNREDWDALNEEKYKKIMKKSAIKRTKFSGLIRNIKLNNKI